MSIRFSALLIIALWSELLGASPRIDNQDYANEAAIIQNMTTQVAFARNGARDWRQTVSVRVQSEGMLRQLGVLSFPYSSANEEIQIEYIRVKKADGSVVVTPNSSIVDTTAEIATSAPTYSDLRQKQIPVKSLGVGDVLEYSLRNSQLKPEVAGQFWYEQVFPSDTVVLSQSLEVSVPKEQLLQVSSPKLKYETHEDGNKRIYVWKYRQLAPSEPQGNQKHTEDIEPTKVSLTTFRNWEEVGTWWRMIAAPQAAVTPAIQQKAQELTAGLSKDGDKARAIYKYVSMRFRYISISFGDGRYRPHTADEVLANQYGDCKDKHTLLVALLKAAGIQAWPALIGAGVKFDSTVPSPSQFNHVITVVPQDGKVVWLDTTQEVAPFGLLSPMIRDEQALVIPASGKPFLLKTPADPPFRTTDTIEVKSSLREDGNLTGHFDIRMQGDNATVFRSAFRQLAPTQWQALAQQMSFAMSYAGEVSGVDVENLDDLDKPFHYEYEYTRKKYSDWENARIGPPLPPIGFGPGDEADKPKEPFRAGSPGDLTYRASVMLSRGLFLEPPPDVSLTTEFADYSAKYSFTDGTFFAERKMTIKRAKIRLDQWTDYQQFMKGVREDQAQLLMVGKADEKSAALVSDQSKTVHALQSAGNTLSKESTSSGVSRIETGLDPDTLVKEAWSAAETVHDYNKSIRLTQQANAIWKKNGTKPPEYAESLVLLSLTKLADSYQNNGSDNTATVYSQWRAKTADLLLTAIDVCHANPTAKPEVLALALELQALQAGDKAVSTKLRGQAGEIRRELVRKILPAPVLAGFKGDARAMPPGEPQSPTLVKEVEPAYSEAGREARITGTVHFALILENDGTPSSVSLIEGLGFGLDEEAAKALKQWRFHPGIVDGKAARVRVQVDVTFRLI